MVGPNPNPARVLFAAFLGYAANELHQRPAAVLYDVSREGHRLKPLEEPEPIICPAVEAAVPCEVCEVQPAAWCWEAEAFGFGFVRALAAVILFFCILSYWPTERSRRRRALLIRQ